MTNAERKHMSRVAALGCIVCRDFEGADTPAEVHHIREGQGMSQRASNWLTVPLCPQHHRTGGVGVAFHADAKAFQRLYGSEHELLARTLELLISVKGAK